MKATDIEIIHLCERCISAIRSHGERVYVGDSTYWNDDYVEDEACEWCEEVGEELYNCHF